MASKHMMWNIISHQGNANKNTVGHHFISISMAVIKKKQKKIASIGKDVEELEPLCIASVNIKWQSCLGESSCFLKNLNVKLPCDPAIPLIGIDSKDGKQELKQMLINKRSYRHYIQQPKGRNKPSVYQQMNG